MAHPLKDLGKVFFLFPSMRSELTSLAAQLPTLNKQHRKSRPLLAVCFFYARLVVLPPPYFIAEGLLSMSPTATEMPPLTRRLPIK